MNLRTRILQYALEIDHPDHYNNDEREETCCSCSKNSNGRSPWPCSNRRHAEALREIVERYS